MYSPAASAGQSSDSVESTSPGGDALNSRLMPRGTHLGDEELVFRNDSSRSKTSQNQSYMASISTGQKARNTLSGSTARMGQAGSSRSANSSTVSVNQAGGGGGRSMSSAGHYGGGMKAGGSRMPARASAGVLPSGGSMPGSPMSEYSEGFGAPGGKRRPGGPAQGHQRKPSIDARGFLRTLNDLFFAKFCVDELFYREYREQLVKRIQESTYRYDPADLQDILDDVAEACKSTRLNLDAVSQWRLNYFTRDQTASVIDHVFLMNANIMIYDAKYSTACLDVFCADPLCSEIHAGRVSEEDKAKAFRRTVNIVLNEALRVRLITKDQKGAIRQRLVKSVFAAEDRVNAIREVAVLVMLAQDERHRDFVAYALNAFGQAWVQSDTSVTDVDEDCNLDPDMVYRKALGAINNTYLESILDVRRLGMSISIEEVGKLRELWGRNSTRVPDGRVLTLPMLLHLLVHCSESELQEALPQAGVSVAALAKADGGGAGGGGGGGRIEQVEDAALQIVQNLGLAWELGDNPPRDLRQFCMVLLLDLGSVLSTMLVPETPRAAVDPNDADAREIGAVEDGLFARWWEACDALVRFERAQRRFYPALLITYIKISSEKLLAQKADFDPELFLSMVVELLTEYRKRRPDYAAVVLTPDGRLAASAAQPTSSSNDALPGARVLDRRTREDIGSEFDRLFAWVDQQLPQTNRVRSLTRAPSPKGARTASWQQMTSGGPSQMSMDKMRSSSSASIGYGSTTSGNRVASPLPPMPANTAQAQQQQQQPASATRERFL
ncbi:hypothetical protein GGI07_001830 [Coemansia sp. Benny D115]|nr:hypothetical protein GGI07_001830 [Coemansia sp. Benny D115]